MLFSSVGFLGPFRLLVFSVEISVGFLCWFSLSKFLLAPSVGFLCGSYLSTSLLVSDVGFSVEVPVGSFRWLSLWVLSV